MSAFTPELLLSRLCDFTDAQIGWIAYSGGVDSSVLLHALVTIRHRLAFEIRALHVDHGLHPDAPAWVEHCACTCARLRVPHETRRVEVVPARGESLEAVARTRRYEAIAGLLGPGDLVLTAQHRDDQAETLLLALMRGSGPTGLAAMPRMAPLGAGRLVRPLLDQSHAQLLEYAASQNLSWLEDPGNRDLRFDRNYLRHRVLPLLAERWPACATSIARSAAHCAEAQTIIDLVAQGKLAKAVGQRPGTLSIDRLRHLDLPLRKAVLRGWFRDQGQVPPDFRHLDRVLTEMMTARADANPLVSWPGCQVRRYRDDLFALKSLPPVPAPHPIHWDRGVLSLPSGLGCLELRTLGGQRLDPRDLSAEGMNVRFGVKGLSCRRAPGGHRQSVRKLFQEAGVPPWMRRYFPLLFAEGDLIAVGDIWVCHAQGAASEQKFRVRWDSDLPGRLPVNFLKARNVSES